MNPDILDKITRAITDGDNDNTLAPADRVASYQLQESYDGKSYYIPGKEGDPVPIDRVSMRQYGLARGFSADKGDDELISEVNALLLRIQTERYVTWVGRLAGYSAGNYVMNGQQILVLGRPTFITAVEGDFPLLRGILDNLLGAEQLQYFFSWLKIALAMLTDRIWQPGQVLALCGPRNAGKNLLRELITEILGGRVAHPHGWMTGRTNFNSDAIGSETLAVEDQQESIDIRARRGFGAAIKDIAVNAQHRAERKHCDAVSLEPLRRLIISLNDEPERLLILPPLDSDIEDKLMLFKVTRAEMPMPTGTGVERKAFRMALSAELPMFVNFLQNKWTIPAELRDSRFGVKAYHHPQLVSELHETTPESHLFDMIAEALFSDDAATETWTGTASQLENILTGEGSHCAARAKKILTHSNTCGTYLGRLATLGGCGISGRKVAGHTLWKIEKQIDYRAVEAEHVRNGRRRR